MKKASISHGLPTVAIVILAIFLFFPSLNAKTPAFQEEASVDVCAECHDDIAHDFQAQPHAGNNCIACHGDAETHLGEGGGPNIFSYGEDELANDKSTKCLTCHSKTTGRYFASPHGKSAMDCTSCHLIHAEKAKPALLRTSELLDLSSRCFCPVSTERETSASGRNLRMHYLP